MQLLLGSSVVLEDYLSSASDGTEKYGEILKNAFDSPVCVCRWCVVRAHLLFHVGDCIIADNSELEKEALFSISRDVSETSIAYRIFILILSPIIIANANPVLQVYATNVTNFSAIIVSKKKSI